MLVALLLTFASLLSLADGPAGEKLSELAGSTPIIVTGTVIEVEQSPGVWSKGNYFVAQKVKYRVGRVIKGRLDDQEIIVHHYLYRGSPRVLPDKPQLSTDIFSEGKTIILFIRLHPRGNAGRDAGRREREFIETDSSYKVLAASEENIRLVNTYMF